MPEEKTLKSVLRQALSPNVSESFRAVNQLTTTAEIPPTFFQHLLTRTFATTAPHHVRLYTALLGKLAADAPQPESSKKLAAQVTNLRNANVSCRSGVNAADIAATLIAIPAFAKEALRLLVAALAAIEQIPVPQSGAQVRGKRKALAVAYRHAHSVISVEDEVTVLTLFENLDAHIKHPHEALVAFALLAPTTAKLSDFHQRKFLATLATMSMKAPALTRRIVEVAAVALSEARAELVLKCILPTVERSLLREPEKALPACAQLFGALREVDLSTVARSKLVPIISQATKSKDADVRLQASVLAGALGFLIMESSALADSVDTLISVMKTARYTYQRISCLECVGSLLSSAPFSEKAFEQAFRVVRTWLISKKDNNGDARMSGLRSLVQIFSRMSSEATDASLRECGSFFTDVLLGKLSDVDQHALVKVLTEGGNMFVIPETLLTADVRPALENIFKAGVAKNKPDIALSAVNILCEWTGDGSLPSQVEFILKDEKSSPAFAPPSNFSSVNDARCAIRCCAWVVHTANEATPIALAGLYRFCLDSRAAISTLALKELRNLRKPTLVKSMFSVLWDTQFCGENGDCSKAKSYSFDDGMVSAERLGRTLLAVVTPDLPTDDIARIMLAANHPRLCEKGSFGLERTYSRYWSAIERGLEKVDPHYSEEPPEDWLETCLHAICGELGLRSEEDSVARAAVNSLCNLSNESNKYSSRTLRRAAKLLRPVALEPVALGPQALQALEIVKEAEEILAKSKSTVNSSSAKKAGKKQAGKGKGKYAQEDQAQADRARAAAATASAAAERLEAANALATKTSVALRNAQRALISITALGRVSPRNVHNLMASWLSSVLPLVKFDFLEEPCRDAIMSLAKSASGSLRSMYVQIAACLFGLEKGLEVQSLAADIIRLLKEEVPPALSAEDFSLVSPVIRAVLLREPDQEDGTGIAKRGSTKRRDVMSLVKAAAQVLIEHCKPEAVDSAVAAAGCRAGSWTVRVLEREDGAFAAAADALAFLAGTALTPGIPSLSQVLEGILSGKSSVRDATLAALARIPPLSSQHIACPRDAALGRSLWLACFDPDEANAELADDLWLNYGHPLFVADDVPILTGLLSHKEEDIRKMTAKSISSALVGKANEVTRTNCISGMFSMYAENLQQAPTDDDVTTSGGKKGAFPTVRRGRERPKDQPVEPMDDGWTAREGVALAVENLALNKAMSVKDVTVSFSFLVGHGLGDPHDKVRAQMARAATAVVEAAGELGPLVLLPMIEGQLNTNCSNLPEDEVLHADRTRENLVMCLGAVAGFLPPEDERVSSIASQVMKCAMETPSEVVQNAAARCLGPLAETAIAGESEDAITKKILKTLWDEQSSYGERRGAAYALAGIGSGLGLKYLKRAHVIKEIQTALPDKNALRRQGAFLLLETCAIMIQRLFEPYVVAMVPFFLSCMSDSVIEVRNACWAAAQAAMSELSSQGVKMVLPSLVDGLKDRQWRTKAGSAEVLGAMAFCAPRQLAQCLPQVVPKLAESLADAHPNVVKAAEGAINRIAAVVRSPEVRKLSPFLLAALRDPAGRTRGAIDAMLGSEFVHAIDAASLALLIPPLYRGLRDRSSELKKRSAAIVGSMCNNVSNNTDVVPYLDLLLPALRVTLLDAIPDVRRTSARALGALAVSLGEKDLPDIVPWLVSALLGGSRPVDSTAGERPKIQAASVSSSAERSGAAMGLAEVAASMSERRLEDVLNRVLMAGQSSSEAREGGLMLIAAMPRALGERFEGRIGISLAAILAGLADDADTVREAALEAGRNLVSAYAKTSLEHLLPELMQAMREKLWRIRQAATRLLGDMLLVIAGARPDRPDIFGAADAAGNDEELEDESDEEGEDGEGEDEEDTEDEEFESPEDAAAAMTVEAAMKTIEQVLGFDRRNEVLAALYIVRCDVSIHVRQTAMQVWKSVVSNTPRVLREIMPSAVRQIVDGLGDEDEERRAASGKTLSDLAQKLGDRVVPEVLPALRTGISEKENSERIRKGACEGLGELVLACPRPQLEEHALDLIDAVYQGLLDMVWVVRESAAEVFASLLKPLGTAAVDAVVPRLIEEFADDGVDSARADIALDGLKQILRSSGTRLTAIVVPRLLEERPLSKSASTIIATAALVAESTFEPYVSEVTECLIDSVEETASEDNLKSVESVLMALSTCGEVSNKLFLDEMVSKFNEGYAERRIAASRVVAAFCRAGEQATVATSAVALLDLLIRQLADTDEGVAMGCWYALVALCGAVETSVLTRQIGVIRQALRAAASGIADDEEEVVVAGLQVPKSTAPFVPIVVDGLQSEKHEVKEQAALLIGELVEVTNEKSLQPSVVKLTGALIRALSARVPWQVKAAVLKALHGMIKKCAVGVRAFVPQLQSSFVKCLSDGSRLVRVRGCAALAGIVPLQPRVEPLLKDLVALGMNGVSGGARSAGFRACSQVFRLAKRLPTDSFASLGARIGDGLSDEDEDVWRAAGKALGFLAKRAADVETFCDVVRVTHARLDGEEEVEYGERVAILRALGALYAAGRERGDVAWADVEESGEMVMDVVERSGVDPVVVAACVAVGELAVGGVENGDEEVWRRGVRALARRAGGDATSEVRMAAATALRDVAAVCGEAMNEWVAAGVACAGSTNTGVRDAGERLVKSGFVGDGGVVLNERIAAAAQVLNEEDVKFLERKVQKVRYMTEQGEDREAS